MTPEEVDAHLFKIISTVRDKEWSPNDFIGNNCKKLCFEQVMPSLWRLFDQDKIELTSNLKFRRVIHSRQNCISRTTITEYQRTNSQRKQESNGNHTWNLEESQEGY